MTLNACGYGLEPVAGEEGGLLNIEPAQPVSWKYLVGTFEKRKNVLVAEGNVAVEDVYLDGDTAFFLRRAPRAQDTWKITDADRTDLSPIGSGL